MSLPKAFHLFTVHAYAQCPNYNKATAPIPAANSTPTACVTIGAPLSLSTAVLAALATLPAPDVASLKTLPAPEVIVDATPPAPEVMSLAIDVTPDATVDLRWLLV
jgi:hypothetical protein